MDFQDDFRYQLDEISPVLEGKFEIIDYYQKKYGEPSWNRRLSSDLLQFLPLAKNGKPQKLEYVMRRHQERDGKITGTTAVTAAQYAALGEWLGPIAPVYGYSITWRGEIKISETCEYREFTDLLIAGDDAQELATNGNIATVFKAYFQGVKMAKEWCGEPEIEIQPAYEDQEQMEFKHGPRESKFEKLFG